MAKGKNSKSGIVTNEVSDQGVAIWPAKVNPAQMMDLDADALGAGEVGNIHDNLDSTDPFGK